MELALIQCSARKKSYPCEAIELYSESTLFNSSLRYVLANYDQIAILSAKHFIVGLNDVLEPYNVCLNNFKDQEIKEWSEKTADLLIQKYPDVDTCHFYVGNEYRKFLIPALEIRGIKCYSYLEHLGIGSKVSWFQKNTKNKKLKKLF